MASVDNVRSRRRALERMLTEAEAFIADYPTGQVSVIHGNAEKRRSS